MLIRFACLQSWLKAPPLDIQSLSAVPNFILEAQPLFLPAILCHLASPQHSVSRELCQPYVSTPFSWFRDARPSNVLISLMTNTILLEQVSSGTCIWRQTITLMGNISPPSSRWGRTEQICVNWHGSLGEEEDKEERKKGWAGGRSKERSWEDEGGGEGRRESWHFCGQGPCKWI